ncbi:TonB-dependent receptor [Asticcacaulis benevestitus]|uniref:Secretin/TonB short N-terminal domain-containing protein n=1 Tax=Asticcacaulis benevestitus DSM 16100 = ATCC BAA-896 TaxID=1121022 RepID=V4NR31_9CAUL|nr:TonB-dependent receptor [Asticcacaulis benevestitus]ESQ84247.1 hypothetical protein ABENE_19685 [Asticcacaulis benevestitus DSM 16100 = ATCC BAA-896]
MFKIAWFIAAGLCLPLSATALSATAMPRAFNVPEQTLTDALPQLAAQGHVQLLFSAGHLSGRISAPVRGRMEPLAAFQRALAHSDLVVSAVGDTTFVISPAPRPRARPTVIPVATARPIEVAVIARRRTLDGSAVPTLASLATAPAAVMSRSGLERSGTRNAVEALATLSGVTVLNTGHSFIGGVDGASRGEGMYAAIRGLNTELSLNLIDGIPMAQGMPYTRAVQLSLLPPDGLAEVVIRKTSTADMDGDAIGATLDWRTPSAFDFSRRRYAALNLGLRSESQAMDYGDARVGNTLSAEFAGRFGAADTLGLYLSVYSDQRYYANAELASIMNARNDSAWAFRLTNGPAGDNPDGVDPADNAIMTGLNAGVSTGSTQRAGGFVSADWRASEAISLFLKLTAAHADTEQNSTLSQLVPGGVSWINDPATGLYGLNIGTVSTRVWYETNPEAMTLAQVKLGGRFRMERLTLTPTLFAGYSENAMPGHIEASIRVNQNDSLNTGQAPRPLNGNLIRYDADGLPIPIMTSDIYNDLNSANTALLARRAGQVTAQTSSQIRWGVKLDASYALDAGALQSLDAGLKYSTSHRRATYRDWTNGFFADVTGQAGLTWALLGISDRYYDHAFPGLYDWRIPKVDHNRLVDYFTTYKTEASLDTCGVLAINNYNCDTQSGKEDVSAAYISGRFTTQRLEIVPGLRFEHSDLQNTYWLMPYDNAVEQPGDWRQSRSTYDAWLPSLFMTWQGAGGEFRFGLWQAYARPSFVQLAGGAKTTVTNGVTTITQGNPDLKPVTALNLDLSGTWRRPNLRLTLNLYGKDLRDYLFDYGTTPDVSADGLTGPIRYVQPRNGGQGQVIGVEVEIEQHLSDRLTAGLALTGQHTQVDLGSDALGRQKPIQNAPGILTSGTLRYTGAKWSGDVIYSYTSAYLSVYNTLGATGTWDDTWVRPHHDVNLHLGYRVNAHIQLDANLAHVLGGYSYWAHVGKHALNISDVIGSGQSLNVSLKYTF